VEVTIEKGSAELPWKRRWPSLGSYGMSSFSPSIKKSRYINGFTSCVNVFSSFSRLLTCLQCGLQERTSDQLFSSLFAYQIQATGPFVAPLCFSSLVSIAVSATIEAKLAQNWVQFLVLGNNSVISSRGSSERGL